MKLEFVVAALFLLIGVSSAVRSFRDPVGAEDGRSRLLIALHDTAKTAFWLTLGGYFLIYGLVDEPQSIRWLAMAPIGMAGLRLVAAHLLTRS